MMTSSFAFYLDRSGAILPRETFGFSVLNINTPFSGFWQDLFFP